MKGSIITEKDRSGLLHTYLLVFYIIAIYNAINGMWLAQLSPIVFKTGFDGTSWILMQTGIHKLLLARPSLLLLFDILYYSFPAVYWVAIKQKQNPVVVGILWLVVNTSYIICHSLFPATSINTQIAGLMMPFLFMQPTLTAYYYVLNGLRYYFLFFFASAGIWKIRGGGVFNEGQMSNILIHQHKEFVLTNPDYWYTDFIYFLIQHSIISYAFYVAATVFELVFSIGFFTKRYDNWLMIIFVAFVMANFFIMRIPYFSVLPLAITLLYCRGKLPPPVAR